MECTEDDDGVGVACRELSHVHLAQRFNGDGKPVYGVVAQAQLTYAPITPPVHAAALCIKMH